MVIMMEKYKAKNMFIASLSTPVSAFFPPAGRSRYRHWYGLRTCLFICGFVVLGARQPAAAHDFEIDYNQPTASVIQQELQALEFYQNHTHAPAPKNEPKYRRRSVSLFGWEFSLRRERKSD